jgi:hypothetical protein
MAYFEPFYLKDFVAIKSNKKFFWNFIALFFCLNI